MVVCLFVVVWMIKRKESQRAALLWFPLDAPALIIEEGGQSQPRGHIRVADEVVGCFGKSDVPAEDFAVSDFHFPFFFLLPI